MKTKVVWLSPDGELYLGVFSIFAWFMYRGAELDRLKTDATLAESGWQNLGEL